MEEENVQVVLRLRPLSEKERRQGEENVWKVYEGASVVLRREVEDHMPVRKYTQSAAAFNFDRCFGPASTNELVYEATIKGMVDSTVNGINATVFMYGQTGSGKTFTMLGYDQKKGVYNKTLVQEAKRSKSQAKLRDNTPEITFEQKMKQHIASEQAMADTQLENKTGLLIQALKNLFTKIKSSEDKTFFVKCSYVEIYNDQIYDLLQRAENIGDTLQVCEDTAKDMFYIRGVREEAIDDWTDAIEKLKRGEVNRHYARTVMNHSSSRSHTIFRVYIQSLVSSWNHKGEPGHSPAYVTESWFNFVDLAGSEKVSNHDQVEEGNRLELRVKEGKSINKSLFFLTQVIKLKSEGKKTHIPYRNSPLTKILRSSLGGNSRTAIVLCVNPTYSHLEQTLSTMRFGLSAKKIQNKISANVITRNDDEAVKIMIADYEKKLRDNEKDRELLREKEKKLLKKINELENKTVHWAKKMKATQNLKFIDFTGSVPEKDFEHVLLDYQKYRVAHMDEVGLIDFPKKSHSKYSEFCGVMRTKVLEAWKSEHEVFGDLDHECLNKAYHTPSGQLAMALLEKVKNSVDSDLALYNRVQDNWQKLGLETNFVYLVDQIQTLAQITRNNIGKVDQLSNLCEDEAQSSKQIRREKEIFEGKLNVSRLSDEEFEGIASKVEEFECRIAVERKRRHTIAMIRESAPRANIDPAVLESLVNALPVDAYIEAPNEEEDAMEAAQSAYLDKIRLQCKQDSAAVTEFESLEGPSQQEMNDLVFKGCDDLLIQRNDFVSYHTQNWAEFMKRLDDHQREMRELYWNKLRATEELSKKGIKDDESLKGVWLDVDQILEQNRAQDGREEGDNASVSGLSVSQVSRAPRRKAEQAADSPLDSENEKSLGSDTEAGRPRVRSDSLERPATRYRLVEDLEAPQDPDDDARDDFEVETEDQGSASDYDPEVRRFSDLPITFVKASTKSHHIASTPKMSLEGLHGLEKVGQTRDEHVRNPVPIKQKQGPEGHGSPGTKQGPVQPLADSRSNAGRAKAGGDRLAQSPRPAKAEPPGILAGGKDGLADRQLRKADPGPLSTGAGTHKSPGSRSLSKKSAHDREKSPTFGDEKTRNTDNSRFESTSIASSKGQQMISPPVEKLSKHNTHSEMFHDSALSISSKISTNKQTKADELLAELLKAKAMDLKANQRRGRADRVGKKLDDDDL
jgi:hypothetical protein